MQGSKDVTTRGADEVFETPPPVFSEAAICAHLSRDYGLLGTLHELVSERDLNFRLDTPNKSFVVKIANLAESETFLKLQNATLEHLMRVDPELGVPKLIAAQDQRTLLQWPGEQGLHWVRVLSYLPGELYSNVQKSCELTASLGSFMARLSRALSSFGHAAAHRSFLWNLDEVIALETWLDDVAPAHRPLVAQVFARYRSVVLPQLPRLRSGVLYQDANDNNILVSDGSVSGLIDFGDMCFGRQVNELAVTMAYALLESGDDFLPQAGSLIANYTKIYSLHDNEANVLFDLMAVRLAGSVCISSHRTKSFPNNEYLLISQAPALRMLHRLATYPSGFLRAFARYHAGLSCEAPKPKLRTPNSSLRLFENLDLQRDARLLVSCDAVPSTAELKQAKAPFAICAYGSQNSKGEHLLAVRVFVMPLTMLLAPTDVIVRGYDADPTKNHHDLVLETGASETAAEGRRWLKLSWQSEPVGSFSNGERITVGTKLATVSAAQFGLCAMVTLQLFADEESANASLPHYCHTGQLSVWQRLCLDPNLWLGLAPERFTADPRPPEQLLAKRSRSLGPSLSVSYQNKLKIVRGLGAYLYDHTGRAYLDGVNNICHVGHANPHVTRAIADQSALLNTNTRYLHNTILDYADRLASYFPKPLSVVYLVCSGSEANELALRMARTVTGRKAVVALDWGYHGNTQGTIAVSAYKFNRKGGAGKPEEVELACLADPYRGATKGYSVETATTYAQDIAEKIGLIKTRTGEGPAAFIAEAISGCGGQVFFPDQYLSKAAEHVRASGGLVIVDEVQTGFGRVGDHMWAHTAQGVIPDIVTLGKPIGNGHPMAAVVTTPEIAKAFANGMEFFSSFGGNPVSAAAGMAVLDVIENEALLANALNTGAYLKAGFEALQAKHELIGDVRGRGLFLGVELVTDRKQLTPATEHASRAINYARENGVLISSDGPFDNVLKIKPPMVFGRVEADLMLEAVEDAIAQC